MRRTNKEFWILGIHPYPSAQNSKNGKRNLKIFTVKSMKKEKEYFS